MKNISELLRKAQVPLLFASVMMPPTLYIFALLVPERMAVLWLLPLVYLVAAQSCILVPGKRRILAAVMGSVAVTGGCVLVAALTDCWWLVLVVLIYVPALLAVMPVGGWAWHEELPPLFFYLSIGFFLAAQALPVLLKGLLPQLQDQISDGMTVSFLVFAILAMLSMNRNTLNGAASRRHKASINVRRKNGTLVLTFFLLVTFIVATPQIINMIWLAIRWIIVNIIELIDLLRGDEAVTSLPTQTIEQGKPGGLMDGSQTSLFAKLMTKLFNIAFVMLFVVGLPLLLVFLLFKAKRLIRKLKKLMEKWNRFLLASAEDYEEEITDIRDLDSETNLRDRRRHRITFLQERGMSPGERIRYRYGRLLGKHPEWDASKTARDNIPGDVATVYERARYSRDTMTEEDAESFVSGIKRM